MREWWWKRWEGERMSREKMKSAPVSRAEIDQEVLAQKAREVEQSNEVIRATLEALVQVKGEGDV